MNIIIPLGGLGERFKNEGYIKPKALINVFGKPMICHIIDNLQLEKNDKIIIIYNKELEKWDFENTLNYDNIKFIQLNKNTRGAAETLLIGLENMTNEELNKKIMTIDGDTFYTKDIVSIYRKIEENCVFCFNDEQDKPIFSYVSFDEHKNILDIVEKQKISNYANTGCYCFQNGDILKNFCKNIIDNNITQKNEFYTSGVIKQMIENGHKFKACVLNSNDFYCLGTPLQLKIFCDNHAKNMSEKRTFCFDFIDGLVDKKYEPITKNIELCKYLKKLNNVIIINVNIKDIKNVNKYEKVINILKNYNIPYDEINFMNTTIDFYIGKKYINIFSDIEKELGYYRTSVQEREFNELHTNVITTIIKKGDPSKLEGEIFWYKNMPEELRQYFPSIFKYDTNSTFYEMEKIDGVTFTFLYVNENLTFEIFDDFINVIEKIHNIENNDNTDVNIYSNYVNKIKERYNAYDYSRFKNHCEVYKKLIAFFEKYEKNNCGVKCVTHGDPVFSNVILDKCRNIKLIDMRGKMGNIVTMYGDKYYDFGKIYQSLIGYDEIMTGNVIQTKYKTSMIDYFEKYILENYDIDVLENVKMIANSLLFTLIPLHNNDLCTKYYNLINI